jgi:ATP-binding cassette subfamily G (WHITE) protein 2 (SNQ2)
MKPWLSFLRFVDPLQYAIEAMMGNELGGRSFPCEGPNLIPNGPGYNGGPASCAGVRGSVGTSVNGTDYLRALSFSPSHVWRNFGVIWAFWALFVVASE